MCNRLSRLLANFAALTAFVSLALVFSSCKHPAAEPGTAVMLIESSPLNLDPRVGTDAQSERIGELIFEGLVRRDDNFQLQPRLAESWQVPDPLTYVFHLRRDVRFHDGRPMTSADVKWTLDSLLSGRIRSAKTSAYRYVASVDAPDDFTIVIHLRAPYAALLWNLSDGALGVVPRGSGDELSRHPIGTGPFVYVSDAPDREVVLARNDHYWGTPAHLLRVRFKVVPDATTRALELRKGSADAEINALPGDMIPTLAADPKLVVEREPGTSYQYLAMNLRDPLFRDVRVRQALAFAIDRQPMIHSLWHDMARPADSVLPPQHWAYNPDAAQYPYNPARARQLLDAAGYRPGPDGVRFHLSMKTSTDETTRLICAVLQQQLRQVGIALDIHSYEFATFYSDVVKGAFQIYSLRWVGGSNQDPDIFENVFDTASFAPRRANRGYYSNPEVDRLIAEARQSIVPAKRAADYREIQRILNQDLPYIHLWWNDNVLIHTRRLSNVRPTVAGNYDFLRGAILAD
ncbi:MAG: ABC transporter substrate-binding protein [Acidobacteriota bacterium]|nr:ABC transporter substrate-binding protein [Acidobacteriota bacterium]